MGQSTGGARGRGPRAAQGEHHEAEPGSNGGAGTHRLDLATFSKDAPRRELDLDLGDGTTVRLRALLRGEFTALGIDEDSEQDEDEARIVAATVVEPAATWEQWRDALAAMPPGTASLIVGGAMEVNGLGGEVSRQLARMFRAGR